MVIGISCLWRPHHYGLTIWYVTSISQQSEAISRADCFKTCLSAGDDREASAANRNIVPIKMIIFPFKLLPLRKARLSQQTACLVIHDKTSLWMTNERSVTPLHFTRLISDCVRWGQNSHLAVLMPSHGPVKRWMLRTLSEMLPPHSGLLWMWNDCIDPAILLDIRAANVLFPRFHFRKVKFKWKGYENKRRFHWKRPKIFSK